MYDCFCRNKGSYIKLGQLFGQLQSLVPDQYIEVFEPMTQNAPISDFATVRQVLESELGRPLEDIFEDF